MNLRKARIIFFKEMLETLRDKRTLFVMILGPVLVYPLMIIVAVQLQLFQQVKAEERASFIEVVNGKDAPDIVALLKADKSIRVTEIDLPPEEMALPEISRGSDARLIFKRDVGHPGKSKTFSDFITRISEGIGTSNLVRVTLVHDAANFYSRHATETVQEILADYSQRMIRKDIAFVRNDERFNYPMITREIDVSTPVQRGGDVMGNLLPMILIMMTIAGAMYPAIDTTAGEKERGTIETILTAPALMSEVVFGKFLSVFVMSITTGLLNLFGMAVTFSQFLFMPKAAIDFSIPPITFVLVFAILIPLSFLFGALMMAVATYARTFKEAQSYVSILYVVSIFPAMLSTTQGFELEGILNFIPVINLSLLFRELIHQKFIINHIVFTFVSTSIYAGLALWLTVRLFHKENVIFSTERPFSLFVKRRFLKSKETPSVSEGLFLLAMVFVLLFSAGSYLQARDIISGIVLTQIGLILLPTLLFARYLKLNFKTAFSLRRPAFAHVISAILLGISSVIVASAIDAIQSWFHDPSKILKELIDKELLESMGLGLRLAVFALLPAICEEAMFRGFILSSFAGKMKAWAAVFLAGMLFGFFHLSVSIIKGIPAAHIVLGITISFIVWRSGSLWTGMLLHFIYNGTIMFLASAAIQDSTIFSGMTSPLWILGAVIVFTTGIALALLPRRAMFDRQPPPDIMSIR